MNQTNKFISTDYLNQSAFEAKYNRKAFWLVGNSGSGKSTLARSRKKLFDVNIG